MRFLEFVNGSAHLVAFVVVKKDLFKVESVLRLVVLAESLFGLLEPAVEVLIVGQLVHLLFADIAMPNVLELFSFSLKLV